MDLFSAANQFLKQAQITDASLPNLNKLKHLTEVLVSPVIRQDLTSGLLKTLEQNIKLFQENPQYQITTAASKSIFTNIYNSFKSFYASLLKSGITKEELKNQFAPMYSNWQYYESTYLTAAFVNSYYQKDMNEYNYWLKLKRNLDNAINGIAKELSIS
jgi:hypothetical protein